MRVLLINPELAYSFWSFRETCRVFGKKALIPPLGLMTIAALLPEEWELRLVDMNVRQVSEEDWQWAELVMVSGMIAQRHSLQEVIREAKRRGKRVVAGGPYPTALPEEVLEAGCDFLVRGEGENTVPLLLSAWHSGQTHGVIEVQENPCMSSSPVPRFDLTRPADYIYATIQTSRGCPFDCEFCDIVSLFGRKPRHKSPEQVVRELDTLYRLGWRGMLFVSDDNFIGDKSYAREVLERIIPWLDARGEPFDFVTQTSVNLGQDKDLIDLMTTANFWAVFVGVESPDEDVLAMAGKFQNVRNPLEESLLNINKNGLVVIASFVIGLDGERTGAGLRIAALVEDTGIPMVVLNTLHVLPNTRLWFRLEGENRLLPESPSGDTTVAKMNFVPTRPVSEIMGEFRDTWRHLYEPSNYLDRAYRQVMNMRPTRKALGVARPSAELVARDAISIAGIKTELYRVARLLWVHGVRADYSAQFWRQLFVLVRKHPSRLYLYLHLAAIGENVFAFSDEICARAEHEMRAAENAGSGPSKACAPAGNSQVIGRT